MTTVLDPEILVLLIVEDAGECLRGKTLLQKRAFFVCQSFTCETEYRAHYYGPYSPKLDFTLGVLKSLGVIEEKSESFGRADPVGFEWRRYDFSLTADGRKVVQSFEKHAPETVRKVRDCLHAMKAAGDDGDYVNLSIAAKTFFVLKHTERAMTLDEIHEVAKHFGWNVAPEQIDRAGQFLEAMRLTAAESNP
jgi:uncharacterized protein YwgA